MPNRSTRSVRGWVYAILFAAALSTAFWWFAGDRRDFDQAYLISISRTTWNRGASQTPVQPVADPIESRLAFESEVDVPLSPRTESLLLTKRSNGLPVDSSLAQVTASARLQGPSGPRASNSELTNQQFAEYGSNSVARSTELADETFLSETSSFRSASSSKNFVINSLNSTANLNPSTNLSMNQSLSGVLQLQNSLDELEVVAIQVDRPELLEWVRQARATLEEVSRSRSNWLIDFRNASDSLIKQCEEMLRAESRVNFAPEVQSRVARTAYALLRQATVLKCLVECQQIGDGQHFVSVNSRGVDIQAIREATASLGNRLQSETAASWRTYLLVNELEQMTMQDSIDIDLAEDLARRYLARTLHQQVDPDQSDFLSSPDIAELGRLLMPIAYKPIDMNVLERNLDSLEIDSISRTRTDVGRAILTMKYSQDPPIQEFARQLDSHYRNANLRIAVSKTFLERFLPKTQITERPVRETILGAFTQGHSQVNTQIGIELVPDPNKWNMRLNLSGLVDADTRSSRGPATFFSTSQSVIDTARRIEIDKNGLKILSQDANVSSNDSLRGLSTDYDGLPIFGDLVRYIAKQQFDQKKGLAKRIVQRSIAAKTDEELDKQLAEQVKTIESQLDERVIEPLGRLQLNPMVFELSTSETRLVARYRVAGAEQIAAFTPRPLAPSDSLFSTQIHESVINNTIEQMNLSGRFWTLQELCDLLAYTFKQNPWKIPEEVPSDVRVKFAATRPITVEFKDDLLQLTLRIDKIENSNNLDLNRFVIRTNYSLQGEGLNALLVQDGVVSVDGPRIGARERLPLRLIFGRIFAARQVIPLVDNAIAADPRAQGLAVSQLTIRDGWMGFAISDSQSPHVVALQGASPRQVR